MRLRLRQRRPGGRLPLRALRRRGLRERRPRRRRRPPPPRRGRSGRAASAPSWDAITQSSDHLGHIWGKCCTSTTKLKKAVTTLVCSPLPAGRRHKSLGYWTVNLPLDQPSLPPAHMGPPKIRLNELPHLISCVSTSYMMRGKARAIIIKTNSKALRNSCPSRTTQPWTSASSARWRGSAEEEVRPRATWEGAGITYSRFDRAHSSFM